MFKVVFVKVDFKFVVVVIVVYVCDKNIDFVFFFIIK